MKEKLTLQDLADLLAKKTSLTKKEADTFFRELLAIIVDKVFENEPVKIKDFGTFKLIKINSRESIDVNTGAKIEIPAHFKLSFSPDKSLKNLVNQPFAHFETTLLEDGVSFDSLEEITEEIPLQEDSERNTPEETTFETGTEEGENNKEFQPNPVEPLYTPSYSYVYSYNITPDSQDSIILSVPEDNINAPQEEKTPVEVDKTENKETIPEGPDDKAEDILSYQGDESESAPTISLEVNKVKEQLDELKDVIDSFKKKDIQPEDTENIQIEKEASIHPKIKEEIISTLINENLPEGKSTDNEPINDIVIPVDPQENKDPIEDITDEILKSSDRDSKLLDNLESLDINNEETHADVEIKQGVEQTIDELDVDDELSFYDYEVYNRSFGSRIKQRLPIIIFILLVFGIGVYLFFKLFDDKSNYSPYPTKKTYMEADTFSLEAPEIIPLTDSIGKTDSTNIQHLPDGLNDIRSTETNTHFTSEQEDLSSNIPVNINETEIERENSERIISKNLRFNILNKALNQLKKRGEFIDNIGETVVMESGGSLRSLASTYYGNNAFWVYIYWENRDNIDNYNNIPLGMTLNIPDPKKYDIDPDNPVSVEKAKEFEKSIIQSSRR